MKRRHLILLYLGTLILGVLMLLTLYVNPPPMREVSMWASLIVMLFFMMFGVLIGVESQEGRVP